MSNGFCFRLPARASRVCVVCAGMLLAGGAVLGAETVKVYPYPMNPRQHPDDPRRAVKPPDQATFKNRLQFMALRSMNQNYMADLDRYTQKDRLGDIIWAHYQMINDPNVEKMVKELKRRDLYLFDLWGFVPGSGPGDWQQFKVPDGVLPMFERELGDHWLGMDNGEQDGRYVGGYAGQAVPCGADRAGQYLNFQRHFERMGDLLGNKLATLVSLNFGHYFMREGIYTLIGAETAQGLPNSQLYYSFIRGAGKQYGVPWFGNVSVYNRWGFKHYSDNRADPSGGSTKGTSLALMKRLMYTQILYNSVAVGFESSFYGGDGTLSPIGAIQQNAVRWSEAHGDPGVMHVPVAVMADFLSGWSFPRHLYSGEIYKVWGALPYDAGDYLTDGVFDLLYPGYQDSSYFHDERGFMTPTPFGDIADGLLSDAPGWLLRQYAVLVVAGRLEPSAELADTLAAYVRQGGHLVLTAANAARLFPDGIAGIRVLPETMTRSTEQGTITLHALKLSGSAQTVCHLGWRTPAAARGTWDKGQVTVFASPYGIAETPRCALPAKAGVDKPLDKPYPLLAHVRDTLAPIFKKQMLFGTDGTMVGEGLSLVTCRRAAGEYTVALCNNTWEAKPFALVSLAGAVTNVIELATDIAEKTAVGFLPESVTNSVVGKDTDTRIAGGAVRLFRVLTDETRGAKSVQSIPVEPPTPNPTGRGLALRDTVSIQRELLLRPTFFRHFDTVLVDWRYVSERDKAPLAGQAGWLKRQGVRIVVDLSSGINLFPDLRLVNNDTNEYVHSLAIMDEVLEKMKALGAKDLLISLHRMPENNYARDKFDASLTDTCRTLARKAASAGITVHLRQTPKKETPTLDALAHWVKTVNEPNFRAAPALAALLAQGGDSAALAKKLAEFPCGLMLLSGCERDPNGQLWNLHTPLSHYGKQEELAPLLRAALERKDCMLVLDACYASHDDEYRDARLLETP